MKVSELRTLIIKTIADQLNLKVEEVKSTCKLVDDLKVDDLDLVEIVMSIEETLGISIPDEDLDKLVTVEDLTAYANSKLPEDKPADKKEVKEPLKESGDDK